MFCAEVAGVGEGRFGWARSASLIRERSAAIEYRTGSAFHLAAAVADELQADRPVALGFECPLFVPVPAPARALGGARVGESGRPWSSGAGATALANGVVQIAWALAAVRERCPGRRLHIEWPAFAEDGAGLLIWEAFVDDRAGKASAVDSATVAVEAFVDALPNPTAASAFAAERPLSLAGAVALWSGWLSDPEVLRRAPLVIRAESTASAAIRDPALNGHSPPIGLSANAKHRRGVIE